MNVKLVAGDFVKAFGKFNRFVCRNVKLGKRLTVFDVRGVSCASAEQHYFQNVFHTLFEVGVNHSFVANGEIAKVNRFGRVLKERGNKVLINAFRHKRSVRRKHFRKGYENRPQRGISRRFVVGHFAAPVSFPAAANVPVGKFVNIAFNHARGFEYLIVVKPVVYIFNQSVQL